MLKKSKVVRVADAQSRVHALEVLRSTYQDEKRWVEQAESQLPESDLTSPQVSWFVAYRGAVPAGVLRVYYEPPVAQYRAYDVKLLDQGIDVDRFLATNRIAEIGRFAIVQTSRNLILQPPNRLNRRQNRRLLDKSPAL
jgi:hypothetical protein